MEPFIYFAIPDDKDLLAAFGALTIRHEQLNYILRMMIETFRGICKEKVLCETSKMGSAQLRKCIKKLAEQKLREDDALPRLHELIERSERASEKRNELIHSVWGQELDGNAVMKYNDRKWKVLPDVLELEKLSEEIDYIRNELIEARFKGGFLWESLAKKPKQRA
jgi:hypothetical protein